MKIIKEKYYDNSKSKYFIDCNKHIIDKSETTLVECKWSSLRGRFVRFIRKTKTYSKSFENLKQAVFMWIHRNLLIKNRIKYSSYYGKSGNMGQ